MHAICTHAVTCVRATKGVRASIGCVHPRTPSYVCARARDRADMCERHLKGVDPALRAASGPKPPACIPPPIPPHPSSPPRSQPNPPTGAKWCVRIARCKRRACGGSTHGVLQCEALRRVGVAVGRGALAGANAYGVLQSALLQRVGGGCSASWELCVPGLQSGQ